MAKHNIYGKAGEEAAAQYLIANGYRVLHRNWRSGRFEIDIVAEKDGMLVSIEVKTRHTDALYRPYEAVTRIKRRRLLMTTNSYIRRFHITKSVRFDVISIVGDIGNFKIEHIREAFTPQQF